MCADDGTDAELLRRAGRGDEEAFVALYRRHRTAVFRFAYRFLGSVEAAEDVTHECFMSLLRRPEGYRPELAALRTYLCAAARNLAFKHLRRQSREVGVDELPEPMEQPTPPTQLHEVIAAETAEAVAAAVAALPPLQREALVLFEYEELSLAEIAEVAATDVGTIKSRLHRARERMRRTLSPWMTRPKLAEGVVP